MGFFESLADVVVGRDPVALELHARRSASFHVVGAIDGSRLHPGLHETFVSVTVVTKVDLALVCFPNCCTLGF
jgi:hypothetical protein